MNLKKILNPVWKTALTIACPPIGLPTWVKKGKARLSLFGSGLLVSLILSGSIVLNKEKTLYDKPSTISRYFSKRDAIPLALASLFFSPLILHFSLREGNIIKEKAREYVAYDGVIKFNKNNRKYDLLLSEDNDFGIGAVNDYYSYNSISKLEQELEKEISKRDMNLANGNILELRKRKTKIEEMEKGLEQTRQAYEQLEKKYQEVVDKMNAELDLYK